MLNSINPNLPPLPTRPRNNENSKLIVCHPTCNAQSWWSSGRTVGHSTNITLHNKNHAENMAAGGLQKAPRSTQNTAPWGGP